MSNKTIILSPHLDDAIFSCWHLLDSPNTTVVTIFAGAPPEGTRKIWDWICGTADSHLMMSKRIAENALAFQGLAAPHIELPFLEQQYRQIPITIAEIVDTIKKQFPTVTSFVVPIAASAVFRHPDHVILRDVGKALADQGMHVAFYADIPYMATDLTRDKKDKLASKASALLGRPYVATVIKLTEAQQKAKKYAMAQYGTQLTMTNLVSFGKLKQTKTLSHEVLLQQ